MNYYKTCPLKKRPIFYEEEVTPPRVDDMPQDLSLKRRAEEPVEEIEAKRNFPLNLTVNSMYDRMKVERPTVPVYTRPESPISVSSDTSHSHSPMPTMEPEYPIHLRGLSSSTSGYSRRFMPYPLTNVWHSYPAAHQGYLSSQPPIFNCHQMTPPSSPGSYSTSSTAASSEPEDLTVRNDIPLPALFHVCEDNPSGGNSSVSSKTYRFKCDKCSKMYSTSIGLSKHQQYHCPAAKCNQEKKQHSCQECGKLYTTLGALKMHIRTHTLPCKCPVCGKAFSRPWLLQGHIRTHTGEKPFACSDCNRSFADRSNLRAHQQTHVDVKKYACHICHKSFSRMSLLNKHANSNCTITIV